MYKSSLVLLFVILVSCNSQESNTQEKVFFDLNALIEGQISKLSDLKPMVSKSARINEDTETLKTRAIDWDKELALLKEADLNKAAFTLSYTIEETDSLSSYRLKAGENLPVKLLKIVKNMDGGINSITAELGTDNYLYTSSKIAKISLKDGLLNSYKVNGWQKLFIGNEKTFEISGQVVGK